MYMVSIPKQRDRRIARTRHAIMDKDGLSEAVAYLIEAAGSTAEAANDCDIPGSRALFHALRERSRVELASASVVNLQKGFDKYEIPIRVQDYLTSPSVGVATNQYEAWMAAWAHRAMLEVDTRGSAKPSRARREELRQLFQRAENLSPTLMLSFVRRARLEGHHTAERVALATYRVFEPLLTVRSSGYVELGHEELTDKEFVQFLKYGFMRESLLLKRSPDLQRLRDGDVRRARRASEELVDSNRYMRQLEGRGVRRRALSISDLISGKRSADRVYDPSGQNFLQWISKSGWCAVVPIEDNKSQSDKAPARNPAAESYKKEREAAKRRKRVKG